MALQTTRMHSHTSLGLISLLAFIAESVILHHDLDHDHDHDHDHHHDYLIWVTGVS